MLFQGAKLRLYLLTKILLKRNDGRGNYLCCPLLRWKRLVCCESQRRLRVILLLYLSLLDANTQFCLTSVTNYVVSGTLDFKIHVTGKKVISYTLTFVWKLFARWRSLEQAARKLGGVNGTETVCGECSANLISY